jgi:hypothetical protein
VSKVGTPNVVLRVRVGVQFFQNFNSILLGSNPNPLLLIASSNLISVGT